MNNFTSIIECVCIICFICNQIVIFEHFILCEFVLLNILLITLLITCLLLIIHKLHCWQLVVTVITLAFLCWLQYIIRV